MGAKWVRVASAPLPAGISFRFRAGQQWAPGDLDDGRHAVLVDDQVLAELRSDQMLRVEEVSAPEGRGDEEPIHLPTRLFIDPKDLALERLKAVRQENEALKAQAELAKLEAENAALRAAAEAKPEGKAKRPASDTPSGGPAK